MGVPKSGDQCSFSNCYWQEMVFPSLCLDPRDKDSVRLPTGGFSIQIHGLEVQVLPWVGPRGLRACTILSDLDVGPGAPHLRNIYVSFLDCE